jgi:hypothetical protein
LRASDIADVVESANKTIHGEVSKVKTLIPAKPLPQESFKYLYYQANSKLDPVFNETNERTPLRAQSPGRPQDIPNIYANIITAISMSVSYFLATTKQYVPLSPCYFTARDGGLEAELGGVRQEHRPQPALRAFALGVQWLSCGTLVILTLPSPDDWVCLQDLSISNLNKPSTLRLAPFNHRANLISDLHLCSPHRGQRQDSEIPGDRLSHAEIDAAERTWRSKVVFLLERHGIHITSDCKWIRLQAELPSVNSASSEEQITCAYSLSWPSSLCFSNERASLGPNVGAFGWKWGSEDTRFVDPLGDAESWFLAKASRDEYIAAECLAEKSLTQMVHDDDLSEDDDSMSGMLTAAYDHVDSLAFSSIYPTPPEGSRSQPPASGNDHIAIDQPEDHAMDDDIGTQAREIQIEPSPGDPPNDKDDYDNIEHDDLFGDMDSSIYDANDVTEDDFSFFDKPDEPDNGEMETLSSFAAKVPEETSGGKVRFAIGCEENTSNLVHVVDNKLAAETPVLNPESDVVRMEIAIEGKILIHGLRVIILTTQTWIKCNQIPTNWKS